MKKYLTALLLMFFVQTAQADDVDPRYFKDWLTLSGLLESKGIPAYSPSWSIINPRCLPLKQSTDESDFNRCLYEKAMDEYQWHIDDKYCTDRAEQDYRSYTQKERQSSGIYVNVGSQRVLVANPYNYYNAKPKKDRAVYYSECMIENLNWSDPQNWMAGHRENGR